MSTDWGLAGGGAHPGQHHSDIAADEAALGVLLGAGVGVLSEESGLHEPDRDIVVVVDPLDGSTNALHGIPWYAVSLCAVDAQGPLGRAGRQPRDGERFEAVRGGGAQAERRADLSRRQRRASAPRSSGCPDTRRAASAGGSIGCSGRLLSTCAAVACGRLDAFVDCSRNAHGPWDYLGGMLVCLEAGAVIIDAFDRDLVVLEHAARRTPVAAASQVLLGESLAARRSFD